MTSYGYRTIHHGLPRFARVLQALASGFLPHQSHTAGCPDVLTINFNG
jgi:hypothetical protein